MDKIIEALAQYFSPKFKDKLKRCESLEKLLKKLQKKHKQLSLNLAEESDAIKRENLQRKIAVLEVQMQKAQKLLEEHEARAC